MKEKPRRTVASRWVGDYWISVHGESPVSTEDWERAMPDLKSHIPFKGSLVYTQGGSPTAVQRKQMRELYPQNEAFPPTAILTDSVIARTAITALSVFIGNKVKGFPPPEVDAALTYIGAPASLCPEIKKALEELKAEMGITT